MWYAVTRGGVMDSNMGVARLPTASVEQGVESMCRVTDCGYPSVAVGVVLLCLTAAFLLLGGSVLMRLRDAREAVATERTRTTAERDAFDRFKRRTVRLEPDAPRPPEPPSAGGGVLATAGGSTADSDSLDDAREAYVETVMSTPHYEEEYDETFAESLAAEFGDGVAGVMVGGGTLTPQLRARLVDSAERAREEREELLADLDREEAGIDAASDTLAPAVEAAEDVTEADLDYASYTDLVADYERLEWHEERVEALLRDRQATVHDREAERPHWYEYLYGELRSSYPVVGAATEALSELAAGRDAIASAASRR